MAFFSKVGNMLRQTTTRKVKSQLSLSRASIFQAIRCMSSSKVFIGGLSYSTDEPSLREVFGKYGEVIEARVIVDRETGRSRGFGFVTYTSTEEASSAIQALDEQDLHGRRIKVNYAHDRSGGFRETAFGGNYGSPGDDYGNAGSVGVGAGSAGGYGGGAGGYVGGPGGYGGGAGGYGGGGAGGYSGSRSDNYVQGGASGGYVGDNQFGGGSSQFGQFGGDTGGNSVLGGGGSQLGGEFGSNSQQFGNADQ